MFYKVILFILISLLITGCNNTDEQQSQSFKNEKNDSEQNENVEKEQGENHQIEKNEDEKKDNDSSGNHGGFELEGFGEIKGFELEGFGEIKGFELEGFGEIKGFELEGFGEIKGFEIDVSVNEEEQEIKVDVPDHLLFDFDSSVLKPEAEEILDEISDSLTQFKEANVQINGHTDNVGDPQYNQTLSEERAAEVEAFLKSQDELAHINFSTKGYGETQPLVANDSDENRQRNRRVEIIIEPLIEAEEADEDEDHDGDNKD